MLITAGVRAIVLRTNSKLNVCGDVIRVRGGLPAGQAVRGGQTDPAIYFAILDLMRGWLLSTGQVGDVARRAGGGNSSGGSNAA
jgi:hypothetical protein